MCPTEQNILVAEAKRPGRDTGSNDFKIGKLGGNTTTRYVFEGVHTISDEILADFGDFDEFCYDAAHKQNNSS